MKNFTYSMKQKIFDTKINLETLLMTSYVRLDN